MFYGDFKLKDDLANQFEIPASVLDGHIHYAAYRTEAYEGYALVIFTGQDGKLYEVNSSHCSCNGLEGSWLPEETTWEAIGLRLEALSDRFLGLDKVVLNGIFERDVLQ